PPPPLVRRVSAVPGSLAARDRRALARGDGPSDDGPPGPPLQPARTRSPRARGLRPPGRVRSRPRDRHPHVRRSLPVPGGHPVRGDQRPGRGGRSAAHRRAGGPRGPVGALACAENAPARGAAAAVDEAGARGAPGPAGQAPQVFLRTDSHDGAAVTVRRVVVVHISTEGLRRLPPVVEDPPAATRSGGLWSLATAPSRPGERTATLKRELWIEIDRRRDELARLCADGLRVPAENLPGDTRTIADYYERILGRAGVHADRVEPRPTTVSLVATLPGRE